MESTQISQYLPCLRRWLINLASKSRNRIFRGEPAVLGMRHQGPLVFAGISLSMPSPRIVIAQLIVTGFPEEWEYSRRSRTSALRDICRINKPRQLSV